MTSSSSTHNICMSFTQVTLPRSDESKRLTMMCSKKSWRARISSLYARALVENHGYKSCHQQHFPSRPRSSIASLSASHRKQYPILRVTGGLLLPVDVDFVVRLMLAFDTYGRIATWVVVEPVAHTAVKLFRTKKVHQIL